MRFTTDDEGKVTKVLEARNVCKHENSLSFTLAFASSRSDCHSIRATFPSLSLAAPEGTCSCSYYFQTERKCKCLQNAALSSCFIAAPSIDEISLSLI
jgi:hypothetical protein